MYQTFRIVILWIIVLGLAVSGCAPTARVTAESPVAQVTSQPIQLKSPVKLTAAVVEEPAPEQAPSSEAAFDGVVWEDLNSNGLQDLNEPGLAKVNVNLFNSSRAAAGTATTDQNGFYRFQNLVPGDYYLSVAVPTGYVVSPQDQGLNELVDSDNNPVAAETAVMTLVAGENGMVWTTGLYSPTAAVQPDPGTVRPPPADIKVCAAGIYSLGGISTLRVDQLAAEYCLHAFLWSHGFAIGQIPEGAGTILSDVTFVEIFYQNSLVYKYDVPGQTQSIQVCYAVPSGKQAAIYFFDHYGPRFGRPHSGRPVWEALPTTVQNGIACAVAQTSGGYALIGK